MWSLLLRFFMFVVVGACWIAILWLGIQPDYSKWPDVELVSAHVLPPLGVCLFWWLGSA